MGKTEWLARLLTNVLDWLPVCLSSVSFAGCALMAIVASLQPSQWGRRHTLVFVLLVLAGVASTVLGARKQRELADLRRDNQRLISKLGTTDYFKTFDDLLSTFSGMLGCGDTERLTVYLRSGNNFIVLGRFAVRPQLGERSRPIYPMDEGLIAAAWRNGWAFEPCLPHPEKDEYFEEVQKRWKISRPVVENFRLKARCLGGTVVTDHDRNRLAVIIFESGKCRKFPEAELRPFLEGAARAVAQLVRVMKPYEPDPSAAKKEGL